MPCKHMSDMGRDWRVRASTFAGKQGRFAYFCCLGVLLSGALTGCAEHRGLTKPMAPGECPAPLRDGVHITASVAESPIPAGVTLPSGEVKVVAGTVRRVLLAVEVSPGLPRLRLLSNSVEILTFGGTLAGWARVVAPAAATSRESIQASDGYLRITPFIPGQKLGSYTQSIDVLIVPGGAPVGGLALRPGPMWDKTGSPTAPRDLTVQLVPILHLKVLDVVTASVQLDFTALHLSGAHEHWRCSTESDVQFLDHRSALPNLWVLRRVAPTGSSYPMLALYNPSVGAFPAAFLDPATAAGFARWLRETHAVRVGDYAIGLISKTNANGFQTASKDDLGELEVAQFGADSTDR